MSRKNPHNTARFAIALAGLGLAVALAPVGTTKASAATFMSAPAAKTAPGQPKFGDRGPGVAALQSAIMKNGFTLKGGADGVFDERTRKVLRTFQRVVGLKVTGVVDSPTVAVLKLDAVAATSTTSSSTSTTSTTVATPSFPLTVETLPTRGAKGDNVVIVQKALAAAGVVVRGGVDGTFGSGTAATIAAFQGAKGVKVTGTLDPSTARLLGLIAPESKQVSTSAAATKATKASPARLDPSSLPSRGDRGRVVRIVQRALVGAGVTVKGGVDGVFGGATTVALRAYQTSKGLPVTGRLDIRTAASLELVEAPAVRLSVFPVQGHCGYTNTWHAPRSEGRQHLGVDIIAKEGNLVYAVADGTITKIYTADKYARAGNGVRLTTADGTYFFYGHFSRIADGIGLGVPVRAGQVIGYIGKTGDTNTPHLHFEVHPGGGDAIDPTPIVEAVDACDVTAPLPVPGA